jgi:hypothetical protein
VAAGKQVLIAFFAYAKLCAVAAAAALCHYYVLLWQFSIGVIAGIFIA